MSWKCELSFVEGVVLPHDTLYGEFDISSNEIQLWRGPNGIGKSALLNHFRTHESLLSDKAASFCMQKPIEVLGDATVGDLLHDLFEFAGGEQSQLLSLFSFEAKRKQKIRELSGGENQILKLISALSLNRDIYFLDEATTHLDEGKIKILFEFLVSIKESGKSIIMIEHHPYAQKIADKQLFFTKNEKLEVVYGI